MATSTTTDRWIALSRDGGRLATWDWPRQHSHTADDSTSLARSLKVSREVSRSFSRSLSKFLKVFSKSISKSISKSHALLWWSMRSMMCEILYPHLNIITDEDVMIWAWWHLDFSHLWWSMDPDVLLWWSVGSTTTTTQHIVIMIMMIHSNNSDNGN